MEIKKKLKCSDFQPFIFPYHPYKRVRDRKAKLDYSLKFKYSVLFDSNSNKSKRLFYAKSFYTIKTNKMIKSSHYRVRVDSIDSFLKNEKKNQIFNLVAMNVFQQTFLISLTYLKILKNHISHGNNFMIIKHELEENAQLSVKNDFYTNLDYTEAPEEYKKLGNMISI